MAKLISKHVGIITSIQPTEWVENMEEWAWRKKYENFRLKILKKHFM